MKTSLKKYSIIFFLLFFIRYIQAQVFSPEDTIKTNISEITYDILSVQSEKDFNYLFYSQTKKNQNLELLTIKDAAIINRTQLKNPGLDGGGAWFQSACMDNDKLLLYHVDGFLVIYKKNKKGNYALERTINIKKQTRRPFNTVSLLDVENIILKLFKVDFQNLKYYSTHQ